MTSRKQYSPEEKVSTLKRHLIDKDPVSQICDELNLNPNVFYKWQKQFFENGASAFENRRRPAVDPKDRVIQKLEEKLNRKTDVLAEITEEFVKVKKQLGEL